MAIDGRRSKFPQEYDVFEEKYDISPSDLPYAERYQKLKLKSNRTPEEESELQDLEIRLKSYINTPEDENLNKDVMYKLQHFFKEQTVGYIEQKQTEFQTEIDKFSYKLAYNPTTIYLRNNWVVFNDGTGEQAFICIDDNSGQGIKGIDPSDARHWYKITIEGKQGKTGIGIGLTFRGEYNPTTVYTKDNGVQYGGIMFASKIDNNVGNTPNLAQETDYWVKAIDVSVTVSKLQGIRNIVSETDNVNFKTGEITAFNPSTDSLDVFMNSVRLTKSIDYTINPDNQSIDKITGVWEGSIQTPILFEFIVTRNQINSLIFSDGQSIAQNTIDISKLSLDVQEDLNKIDTMETKVNSLDTKTTVIEQKVELLSPTLTVTNIEAGKTLTATDGTTTLTAQPIASQFVFTLPNRGIWTVTYEGQSKEVDVQYNGDYAVEFGLEQLVNYTMLYDQGDENTPITGGWRNGVITGGTFTKNADDISYVATNAYGTIVTTNRFNFDNHKQIMLIVDVISQTSSPLIDIRIVDNADGDLNQVKIVRVTITSTGKQIIKLDCDDVSGLHYISIQPNATSSRSINIKILDVSVLKADDWQTWMSKGSVAGFTDLATLLADTTAMTTLMSNADAIEYMVKRMTGDAMVTICQSTTAMNALVNNIAYEKAFNNPHWFKFMTMIPTSLSAMDSVAVTVPTMTSDTTPSGIVSASSYLDNGTSQPHRAFDKDIATHWQSASKVNEWIQYMFESAISIYKITLTYRTDSWYAQRPKNIKLQGSNDGSTFEDIESFITNGIQSVSFDTFVINHPVSDYKYVRLFCADSWGDSNNVINIKEIQFYGKAV